MNAKTKNLLLFSYLAVLLCWQLNAFGLLLGMLPSRELYINEKESPPGVADFVQFYTAGTIARSPERFQAYDYSIQKKFYDAAVNCHVEHVPYIQYMPFMFAFISPFTLLPINYAWLLWSITGIICGLSALYILVSESNPPQKVRIALIVVLAATCPAWLALRAGQFAWFLMAILCMFSYFFLTRRDILCGIMLALSTTKPQYILLVTAPVLARRRFKVLVAAAITEAALFTIGGLVLGFQNIFQYPSFLLSAETSHKLEGVSPQLMVSLRGPLTLLGSGQSAAMAICLALTIGTAVVVIMLAKGGSDAVQRKQDRWLLALSLLGALAFSAHTHFYDMLIISVVGALTIPTCLAYENPGKTKLWVKLLVAFPVVSWLLFLVQPITYMTMAALNAGLVALAIYLNYKRNFEGEVLAQEAC